MGIKKLTLIVTMTGVVVLIGLGYWLMGGDRHDVHWEYSGSAGPEQWASLSAEYEMCGKGHEQSPIDIDSKIQTGTENIEVHYNSAPLVIQNNGHTIQINYAPGSYIKVADHQFELLQFHFHSPSEHTSEGHHAPMEVHFVHKDSLGKLAVMGVFIEKGSENPVLREAWANMPMAGDINTVFDKDINAAALLPQQLTYHSYPGSLTTPPCSEGVKWMVLKNRIQMSNDQITKFLDMIGENARPVQSLNKRAGEHNAKNNVHGALHWAYQGSEGPEQWGALDESYAMCSQGLNQSPISISKVSKMDLDAIQFHYRATALNLINNGHTIQVNYDPGSYMEVGGKKYNLLQFHFHSPSEHEFKGHQSELEVHLVHQSDEGHLAVIGVMMDKGVENKLIQRVWTNMPDKANTNKLVNGKVNINDLLPSQKNYFFYHGSLTTPPCSEDVKWFVMQNKQQVSGDQVQKFLNVIGQNARPVQPANERNVRGADF